MRYWVVLWVDYSLPGGLLGNFIPQHLHPILGEATAKYQTYARKELAYRKVVDLGTLAHPTIYYCEGLKRWEKKVEYDTVVKINKEVA